VAWHRTRGGWCLARPAATRLGAILAFNALPATRMSKVDTCIVARHGSIRACRRFGKLGMPWLSARKPFASRCSMEYQALILPVDCAIPSFSRNRPGSGSSMRCAPKQVVIRLSFNGESCRKAAARSFKLGPPRDRQTRHQRICCRPMRQSRSPDGRSGHRSSEKFQAGDWTCFSGSGALFASGLAKQSSRACGAEADGLHSQR